MHECSNFTHNSPKAEATEGPSAREWVKKSRCIHTSEYLPWGGGVSPPESHRTGRSEEHLVRLHPWKVQNPAKQIHGDGSQPSPCGTLWEGRAGPEPGQEGPSGARAGNGGRGEQCTGTSVCTQTYGHVDIKASFYKGFIFEEPYTCSLPPPHRLPHYPCLSPEWDICHKDKPTAMCLYHPKSTVDIGAQSRCCTFPGFGQMCTDTYLPTPCLQSCSLP